MGSADKGLKNNGWFYMKRLKNYRTATDKIQLTAITHVHRKGNG